MPTALIALGSNINPETNLAAGVRLLAAHVQLTGASPVYRTPPWGIISQAPFLNAVVIAETDLTPEALLTLLLDIERQRKRVRTIQNGPRTLDLDLLAYDGKVMDTERLILPHPRMHERGFVLVPLNDLLPGWKHPVLRRTIADLLATADRTGIVRTEFVLTLPRRGDPTPDSPK